MREGKIHAILERDVIVLVDERPYRVETSEALADHSYYDVERLAFEVKQMK